MANNKSNAHLLNRIRAEHIAIVNRNSATSQHHSADSQRSFSYAIEHHASAHSTYRKEVEEAHIRIPSRPATTQSTGAAVAQLQKKIILFI